MSNSLDQKVKKLYAARSKREAELHAIHEDILHCITNQSRRVKVERLVTKCNEAFMTVVDKNEDLIAFAGKTEDPSALVPSLESYLEAMTTKNDKILTSARNYINSADDKVSEFQEPRASIRSRLPSIMTSSKTSSQRKHDYVIAKMKREEIEKQNEAAIRLAKQKKQMELDELEENNRKRLAEATLQEFELLDAVSKGNHSETTASARSSMRSEKAVQDWINTSLALSVNNEKFDEPEVTKDPPECPSHNNGEAVEDHNTDISRHSIPKNCRGNYILSNETLQQLDPYYTPPENFFAAANTHALYQANLRAQMNQTGQQGMALPSIINQGTADNQPPSVHAPGASSPPIQKPVESQINQNNSSEFFPNAQLQISQSRGPETSSLPKNNSAQQICSRQQINFVPRAPNATLPPFPTTNHPAPAINVPLHPSAPPSPNIQQHNSEPAHPNVLPIPNPVFAPNLTAPIPHAPLINQPLVNNNFQNSNNRVHKFVRSVAAPVPNMPNIPLGQNFVPNMSHWRFPQHRPSLVNQDATTVNNVAPKVQAHIAPSVTNFPQQIYSNSPLLIDMQSPSGTHQENPIATTSNIVPGLATPVFQPTYPFVGPTPLSWSGPQVSAPAPPIPDNASLIKELADAINSKRNDPLPEWKLAQYNGDPLQWHEWYGQFKSAIDSQTLTDDVKLTYLKTLVTGKAKIAIAEFAYCGLMYKDALRTLERKFGQPQAVVSAHLDKLSNFPPLKMHNSDNIINYSAAISSLVGVFKALSYDADLKSASLLNQAVQKLPPNMKESWSLFTVKKHWVKPTLLDFNDWLKEKAEAHDLMKQSATKAKPEENITSVTKTKTASKVFASNSQQRETKKQMPSSSTNTYSRCIVCKGNHRLWECRVFKEKTPTQRAKLVADNKLCFSCLRDKHTFRQSPQPRKCRAEGCNSSHNTLLHGADRVFPTKQSTNPNTIQPSVNIGQSKATTSQQPSNKTTTMSSVTDVKGLLQVTELQLVSSSGLDTKALVLCDTACSNSWVAGSLADRLGLHGKALKLTVKGINTEEVVDTRVVEVTVKPREQQDFEPFTVNPFVKESLNVGSDIINVQALQETYPHLAVLDPVTYSYKDIEMILGQDVYHAIRPLEYFSADEKRSPVAVRLPIVWVLSGPLPSSSCLTSTCFKVNIEQDNELASQVKSWYDIESFGANKQVDSRSAADARAHEILESTTIHNGLRYDVGMLWAADTIQLPNNYFSSLVQLKSLEKPLAKDDDLREKYASTIKEDLNKGYVIEVPDAHKVESRSDKEWYLPHHPVLNPNKPGKVRRVLNGAAKFHGASLNKSLLTGPDLLQNLIYVLLRFRQHPYAVSADIEGMFLQVGVLPSDQPSLRFLWREDPTTNVVVYQYTRHIFGAKDSPTCANYALQRTARDNAKFYPEAATAVLENFYMDDYLDSVESPEKAINRSKELVHLLHLGGFKLTKFVSNVQNLADRIDGSPQSTEPKVIVSCQGDSSHVLGLKWDHTNDTLVVSRGTRCAITKSLTQRLVLSLVSKVFDPIGLVAPFTVGARLLLKDIWRVTGQQWDDELPQDMVKRFLVWSADLPKLENIKIPRSYFSAPFDNTELHMFGDSSQDIFSAVAFLRARVTTPTGKIKIELAFVLGKARVVPMKVMTVPKLELQAALLAARLKNEIIQALTVTVNQVFMWTDSTTVLQWINSNEKQPIFVANRVCEILEYTSVDQWNHVATKDNPADAGTRGMSAEVLQQSSWVNGPHFLSNSSFPFVPNKDVINNIKLGVNQAVIIEDTVSLTTSVKKQTTPVPSLFPFDKFSSYQKYLRIAAYVLRLLPKHAGYRNPDGSITDPTELDEAERHLQYLVQGESFEAERKDLLDNKPVKRSSRIAPHSPFISPNGLIRSSGRIKRLVEVGFNVKYPIILDARHPFVKLFLEHMHVKHFHQGVEYLRSIVQEQYAVLKLRSSLRSIKAHCLRCREFQAVTVQPIMSDLPKERLAYQSPPFTNTGVDYFGPFYVTVRRTTEKRWGFLFTCLTTRAVHVEIVTSMDTSSCVMGVERFVSRRGTPAMIWSDNGTNFIGAEKELRESIEKWNVVNIAAELAHKGIKWRFNPPSAPHQGGIWERLVRSFKRVLYTILGTRRLTDEVLHTTFCLVENALNSRPLTPVSADPCDLNALTPNHFLLGEYSTGIPSVVGKNELDHRKRYARAQSYANAIWSRWIREYVPTLNRRSTWQTPAEQHLKTGDLVWIVEETNPRGYYPTARIVELRYGSDSVARSAVLRTSTGSLVRPLVKLVPVFPTSSSGPEDVTK